MPEGLDDLHKSLNLLPPRELISSSAAVRFAALRWEENKESVDGRHVPGDLDDKTRAEMVKRSCVLPMTPMKKVRNRRKVGAGDAMTWDRKGKTKAKETDKGEDSSGSPRPRRHDGRFIPATPLSRARFVCSLAIVGS